MTNEKILVVDDEPGLRELYTQYLNSSGYNNIIEKADGLDAFVFCSQTPVSLILLDHKMPHLLGVNFLKALRSKPGPNQYTPVILISGFISDFKDSVENIDKTFFLEKPIIFDTLLRYVKIALHGESRP